LNPLSLIKQSAGTLLIELATRPMQPQRRQLLTHAHGNVLDVGIGSGSSLSLYPDTVTHVAGLEPEPTNWLLNRRAKKVADNFSYETTTASAHEIPFEDQAFDTVTFQLTLCTIPDPARALAEARRVLKPDGTLLFLEHLRHTDPKVAATQDKVAPLWQKIAGGCRLNQATTEIIEAAGFKYNWREAVIDKQPPRILSHITWGAATKSG